MVLLHLGIVYYYSWNPQRRTSVLFERSLKLLALQVKLHVLTHTRIIFINTMTPSSLRHHSWPPWRGRWNKMPLHALRSQPVSSLLKFWVARLELQPPGSSELCLSPESTHSSQCWMCLKRMQSKPRVDTYTHAAFLWKLVLEIKLGK